MTAATDGDRGAVGVAADGDLYGVPASLGQARRPPPAARGKERVLVGFEPTFNAQLANAV